MKYFSILQGGNRILFASQVLKETETSMFCSAAYGVVESILPGVIEKMTDNNGKEWEVIFTDAIDQQAEVQRLEFEVIKK